jgi:hypothetical protein
VPRIPPPVPPASEDEKAVLRRLEASQGRHLGLGSRGEEPPPSKIRWEPIPPDRSAWLGLVVVLALELALVVTVVVFWLGR